MKGAEWRLTHGKMGEEGVEPALWQAAVAGHSTEEHHLFSVNKNVEKWRLRHQASASETVSSPSAC